MLKANDIHNAVFSKAMSGYKQDEVDAFLDKVYADYKQFETMLAAVQSKVESLEKELSEKDDSMKSINTVLISAQKLADSIIEDAKKQADETIENANIEAENIKLRTKKALEEIDAVLTEQKTKAQAEVDLMLKDAARKSEGMILAAKDSVTREQLLFDKIKSEVAEFKKLIKDTYKTHLESLSKLPDEVTLSPELAANTIDEIINNEPDLLKFIENTPVEDVTVTEVAETKAEAMEEVEAEETATDATVVFDALGGDLVEAYNEPVETTGFTVKFEEFEDDEEETPTFSNGFFSKQ